MSGKDEIYGTTIDQTTEIEIPTSVNDEAIEDDFYAFGDLPGKRRLNLNWNRVKCREILRQLLGMIYNCTDGMVLAETLDTLRSVLEHMKQGITSDDGLSLRDSPLKPARKQTKKNLGNLRVRSYGRKRHPYTNRVGEKASIFRETYKVKRGIEQLFNISEDSSRKLKNLQKSSFEPQPKQPSSLHIDPCQAEPFEETEIVNVEEAEHTNELIEEKRPAAHDDDVTITKTTSKLLSNKHCLNEDDIRDIENGDMLTDMHINFALSPIKKQFPSVDGFQCTSYAPLLNFKRMNSPFIQVLFDGKLHWVTISTIGSACNTVKYYDSLVGIKIKPMLAKQIAMLFKPKKNAYRLRSCQSNNKQIVLTVDFMHLPLQCHFYMDGILIKSTTTKVK